jgi:hypothetical protein
MLTNRVIKYFPKGNSEEQMEKFVKCDLYKRRASELKYLGDEQSCKHICTYEDIHWYMENDYPFIIISAQSA